MPIYSPDVLEDLFETNLKKNSRPCRQSDAHFFQSTQVSRFDVPDGTIVIQPDFPLSPLRGTAPAIPVNNISSTVQRSEAEMCTVTAAQSRPITSVVDCTQAQSSQVTLPSVVLDRIRDLFCVSNSDENQNRLSDTVSSSTASDTGQQKRHGEELVTDAVQGVFTSAMSCSSDLSPLDSSYVDAGRIVYTESDVNVVSEVSVVTAVDAPVVSTGIKDNTPLLRISDIRSLCNNTSITLPEVTSVKDILTPSKSKHVLEEGQMHCTEKNRRSPTLMSASKRKQSLRKQNAKKSDVLFKKSQKVKQVSKKRRLYTGNMLMEDVNEEQFQQLSADVHVSLHNEDVEAHVHRQGESEIPAASSVSAGVSVPSSLTKDSDKTSTCPAIDSVHDVVVSSHDSVKLTGVQSASRRLSDDTQHVVPFTDSMLVVSRASSAQLVQDVQHGQAVTSKTSKRLETECGVGDVVSSSAISVPVSSGRVCGVSGFADSVSLPIPTVCVPSSEYPSADHNKNIVTNSDDDRVGHSSETTNKASSDAGLCVPTQSTNEGSSPSLLCGQKQSGASYHLSSITVSGCCLSSVETPYPASRSYSLQDRKPHRITEESVGYRTPHTEVDNIVSPVKRNIDQTEACSASNIVELSTSCHKEKSSKVLSTVSAMTGVGTSTDAAVSGTETESKQSSNSSGKLTLPTPKNSLTCYQPVSSSTAQVSDSSLASQNQLNYTAIQEILGLKTMSESQRRIYTYQPPANVEVLAFNHFRLLQRTNNT